jgi:molybdate transport system regulatory protein
MRYGARNRIVGKVTSVKKGGVMALVKFHVKGPCEMASVLTRESVQELRLRKGDEVLLVVKAIHVLPVKE